MTTSHYHLKNICVIVDRNKYQSQGEVDQMMGIDPLTEKWKSFGWQSVKIDGHDIQQICQALDLMHDNNEKPLAIIADTVKGKGIGCIENTFKYHNFMLTEEEYLQAEKEILENITVLANE